MRRRASALLSVATALALMGCSPASGQVFVPPTELTFWYEDGAGYRVYGGNSPGRCDTAAFAPGPLKPYIPSMCWGPRTMWNQDAGEGPCANPFRPGRAVGGGTIQNPDYNHNDTSDNKRNYRWGLGVESLTGLGMNINLEIGATPPTMSPASFLPSRDGSALLPADPSLSTRPVAMQTRPTLGDSVDLVTGIPMVQETDLVLPFGTAVYRHTRTYSEAPPGRHEDVCYNSWLNQFDGNATSMDHLYYPSAGMFYDWHGQGWMMGEAPLFLIDAHYDQVVYDGGSAPRRCYFVINAFQSIPFDLDDGQYVAPPHFDAYLEHNGEWGGTDWNQPPTIYRVWMYNKSVCYTIRAIYEDVFPGMMPPGGYDASWPGAEPWHNGRALADAGNSDWPDSDHDTPTRQGGSLDPELNVGANGVPYWGVVERIDDRYGNCIDLHYCDSRTFRAVSTDPAQPEPNQTASDGTGDTCYACCQACNEKGQIAYVHLIAGSDFDVTTPLINQPAQDIVDDQQTDPNKVEWTLLYTYRSFPQYWFRSDSSYSALDTIYPYHQQTALHTIHVYDGTLPDLADLVCRTIDYTSFVTTDGTGPALGSGDETILDPIDDIKPGGVHAGRPLPLNIAWSYELRYMYTEPDPRLDRDNSDGADGFNTDWYQDAYGFACPHPGGAARLVKVTKTTGNDDGDGNLVEEEMDREYTLYRWDSRGATAADMEEESDLSRRELLGRVQYSELTTLRSIYRPERVAEVLERLNEWDNAPWTVNMLVLGDNPQSGILSGYDDATLDDIDLELGICLQAGETAETSYTDLASSVLVRWNRMASTTGQYYEPEIADLYGTFEEFESLTPSDVNRFADDLMANFVLSEDGTGNSVEGDPERFKYKLIVPGVHVLRGADSINPGDQRAYRIYRFMYLEGTPPGSADDNTVCWSWIYPGGSSGDGYFEPRRSVYHTPYRDDPRSETGVQVGPINDPDQLQKVTWVTVVDEYGSLADLQLRHSSMASASALEWPGRTDGFKAELPNRRRVIRMNAAGWVLAEDVWEFGQDGPDSFARTGAVERYEYDSEGRVILHKTLAWGTQENQQPGDQGLINVFEYPPNFDGDDDNEFTSRSDHVSYEYSRRGIKFGDGTSSMPLWIEEHEFDPNRRDLRTKSTFYSAADGTQSYVTNTFYEFDKDLDGDGTEEGTADWILLRRTVLGPAMKVGVGSAEGEYYPHETHVYNDGSDQTGGYARKGSLQWRVYGLAAKPGSGDGRFATQFFDYTHYDYGGRISRQVTDLALGIGLGDVEDLQKGTGNDHDDPYPDGLSAYPQWDVSIGGGTLSLGGTRMGPGQPLHAITKYVHRSWGTWIHEVPYGPNGDTRARQTRTYFPQKLEGGIDARREQRVGVFTGRLTPDPDVTTLEEGQVTLLGGSQPSEVKKVRWDFSVGSSPFDYEYAEIVSVDIDLDSGGRPNKVEATGWDGKQVAAEAEMDHFGGFVRERQPDGTVTRTYRDQFGRSERVFVGVQDRAGFWGYMPEGADDLVLTEQRRYGNGTTDIHKVVMTRHFRERPVGQYDEWDWPEDGWVEWHGYDNRLREVWNRLVVEDTALYDSDGMIVSGDSLRTRVTVYDHLDRVLFVAEYGATAPDEPAADGTLTVGTLDINGDLQLPDFESLAGHLLASSPISLSGTVYNEAGLVLEQRDYDVSDLSGDTYLATVTHYDGGGRPVLQIAPNSAPVMTEYDALGRLVSRRVVRNVTEDPPFEIERTDTEYDAAGHAIVIKTYERLHDDAANAPVLTTGTQTNAVVSTVWNWYDSEGRITATANLGAGNATADQFVSVEGDVPPFTAALYDNPPSVDESGVVSRGAPGPDSVPDWAVVTCYHYNIAGQKWIEASQISYDDSTGSHEYLVNSYEYDSLGNVVFMTENMTAAPGSLEQRQTAYLYENGRLVKIAAVLPGHNLQLNVAPDPELSYHSPDWGATDGTLQVTLVDYQGVDLSQQGPLSNGEHGLGARVWTGDTEWSHNKSWPAGVFFPNEATGQPDIANGPDLEFTYYSDGLVRSRKDRLGREFVHHYDTRGQRVRTEIVYPAGLFPYVNNTDYTPNDLADLLVYTYDDEGRLIGATAGKNLNGDDTLDANDIIITDHQYKYHDAGGLEFEYQSYGQLVNTQTTPAVQYLRDYTDYLAFDASGSGNRDRLVGMVYPPRKHVAEQRTVTLDYGTASGDIDDVLSRVTRIHDTTGADPARAVEFDHSGSSRRVARSWKVDSGGTLAEVFAQSLDTTGVDGYAGLDRLGRVTDLHFTPDGGISTIHRYQYGYDSAGNRLFSRVEQDGELNTRSWLHEYDTLGRLVSSEHGELNAGGTAITQSQGVPSASIAWGLDRLGNWTEAADGYEGRVEHEDLDGSAGYESLVLAADHSTDLRNELTAIATDDGSGLASTPHIHDAAGNLVADGEYYYQYDAFNRLAAVYEQNDLAFDADGIPNGGTPGVWRASYAYDALGRRVSKQVPFDSTSDSRWTWYYYDGVRRIQEVHRDPLLSAGIGGNPEPTGGHTTYTDREYVWGPDYVDECLWQVDRTGAAAFVLQDANYNVVALVDQTGQVLKQYDYTPYGRVLAADSLGAYAHNRLGFQGLFADRFDADAPAAEMGVGAEQAYYARNRDYSPEIGRWLQRDPNKTAMALIVLPMSHGRWVFADVERTDLKQAYSDGANLLAFGGSVPIKNTDPLGLMVFGFGDIGAANLLASDLRSDQFDIGSDAIITTWSLLDPVGANYARLGKTAYTFLSTGMIGFQIGKSGVAGLKRVNAKGASYPQITDLRTGAPIHFPAGQLERVPRASKVPWTVDDRRAFIKQWHDNGYPRPPGGWEDYDIHHIRPREFGGDNSFWNLTPVLRTRHQQELNGFWAAWD